ncbi:MAG: ribonuclease Y [Nitrospinota bacterium]
MVSLMTPAGWVLMAAVLVIGAAIGYALRRVSVQGKLQAAEEEAEKIRADGRREAENLRRQAALEAKEETLRVSEELEKEIRERRQEAQTQERRLIQREEGLEKKREAVKAREREIEEKARRIAQDEERLQTRLAEVDRLHDEHTRALERASGMTSAEAKKSLMDQLIEEARHESAKKVRRIEEEAREHAERQANRIIGIAIQRYAADHVAESTLSVVDLPNDEMKGRIIGREGRNIRALEMATGVDLIIDDTPEAVIISGFDPVKREIARRALERLVSDGRIHPRRIEDAVLKVKNEMEKTIREIGEQAALEVGVEGLHPELFRLLGKLNYRTSYSQNVLLHSKEVAHLSGMMAAELGGDVKLAKRAGLLHDIGKALDHEMEGSHTQIGIEVCRRYNEHPVVLNAIGAHHEEEEPTSLESTMVCASDALSAARPGARRETLESHIKRLQHLEKIGESFKGVEKSYAIQAGREIRVIVEPNAVNESEAIFLAKDIAKRIEEELTYPGEIKVTVIRETRSVELAQ